MAKMTLMDMLPGILGLVGGAVSPQAGEAGAATLEMADQFKQRHRRQALMDEEAERRKVSDERAARAEERSIRSFQWAEADQLAQDRERQRVDAERTRALNAFGKMKEQLAAEGYAIPAEYAEWTPDTEENVQQAGREIRTLASNTPMSAEDADAWHAKLKAEGRVVYAPVRRNGIVSKEMLGGYKQQASTKVPPGATQVMNAIEGYSKSLEELELAESTLGEQGYEQSIEALDLPEGQTVDPMTVTKPMQSITTVAQRAALKKAKIGANAAESNLTTTGMLYPELMQKYLPLLARYLGGSDTQGLPAAGSAPPSKEKNVRPEVVSALVAKHSGR